MYYSYVMGIGDELLALQDKGFTIKPFGADYGVAFPKEKAAAWETFVSRHLQPGYWNEYLAEDGVVFLFHLDDGVKKYVVKGYENDEILSLCERLCECKFGSLKDMLKGNGYYSDKMT